MLWLYCLTIAGETRIIAPLVQSRFRLPPFGYLTAASALYSSVYFLAWRSAAATVVAPREVYPGQIA